MTEAETPMGHALELPGENGVLSTHPDLSYRMGLYTWTVTTRNNQSTYTVTDGKGSLSATIQWAFGVYAQTWVLERNGRYFESLVSFYPALDGLAITIGDERIRPQTLDQALGAELSAQAARECFGCHASDAVSGRDLTLATLHAGVTCEHCHRGSLAHAADAAEANFATAPPHLKDLPAESLNQFCGQCHRSWDTVVRNRWLGPVNLRFQPYRLENSRCFDGADPRISCLGCHNPHQNLVHDETYYDGKCLACHAAGAKPTSNGQGKTCPVAKAKCASCHMPKLEAPGAHQKFTDHEIRIVRANEPYPN